MRELVKDAGASVEAIGMRMGSYSNWEVFEDGADETEVEMDVVGEVRTTDEGGGHMG